MLCTFKNGHSDAEYYYFYNTTIKIKFICFEAQEKKLQTKNNKHSSDSNFFSVLNWKNEILQKNSSQHHSCFNKQTNPGIWYF